MRFEGPSRFSAFAALAVFIAAGCSPRLITNAINHFVLPSVRPLTETSVQLEWTKPAGLSVDRYQVWISSSLSVAPDAPLRGAVFEGSATSGTVTGLAAGSVGQIAVVAEVSDTTAGNNAEGVKFWTPYGALNEASVSSVTPFAGTLGKGSSYAEATYVSDGFSMLFGHYYANEFSHVFDRVPDPTTAPLFNAAALVVKPIDGFFMGGPYLTDTSGIWSDGTSKLALAQSYGAHRVLIYNQLPKSPTQLKPAVILGQSEINGRVANNNTGAVSAAGFSLPTGVCFTSGMLYVSDMNNHRVLGWNGWPTQNNQPADFVLGQASMTASAAGSGAAGLNTPTGLYCDSGRLAVVDQGNHRVLIWNTAPSSNVAADVILGQADNSGTSASGAGGNAVGGLNGPGSVTFIANGASTAVLVSDTGNHRVVQWNSIPTSDGVAFDRVYGQSSSAAVSADGGGSIGPDVFNQPMFLSVQKGTDRFWVSDFGNGRFTIWKLNQSTAVGQYGQRSGTGDESYYGTQSATHVRYHRWSHALRTTLDPTTGHFSLGSCGGRYWRTPPTSGVTALDSVQGIAAADYCPNAVTTSSTSSTGEFSVVKAGSRTYWSDTDRILSKTGDFTASNQGADRVLGIANLTGATVVATTWDYKMAPTQLATDGTRLYAIDGPRIIGWSVAPTTSNAAIEFALGQADTLTRAANGGGSVGMSTLSADVRSILVQDGKLYAADTGNHRILIWNSLPSTNGAAPDVVLGQTSFSTSAAGAELHQMNRPTGVAVLNGKLIVADYGNKRLLIWDKVPTASGTAASRTFLTQDLSFSLPSWYDTNASNLDTLPHYTNVAERIHAYGSRLYLNFIDRILVMPDVL